MARLNYKYPPYIYFSRAALILNPAVGAGLEKETPAREREELNN